MFAIALFILTGVLWYGLVLLQRTVEDPVILPSIAVPGRPL